MTVRTWFTISALVLIALVGAIFLRLLAPVGAPPVLVRAGEVRLHGERVSACWPQRGNTLRCEGHEGSPKATSIADHGSFRVVVAFPAQPKDGSIDITSGSGRRVVHERWDDTVLYSLKPGSYELTATAKYPKKVFVTYRFAFRVA